MKDNIKIITFTEFLYFIIAAILDIIFSLGDTAILDRFALYLYIPSILLAIVLFAIFVITPIAEWFFGE
jgi:hypothetical protein